MLNWKKATKRPRQFDGEISAIYIGPTTDEAPTAIPPKNRKKRNEYQLTINAVPIAEKKYNHATIFNDFNRPYFSAGAALISAPKIVPNRAIAIVKP